MSAGATRTARLLGWLRLGALLGLGLFLGDVAFALHAFRAQGAPTLFEAVASAFFAGAPLAVGLGLALALLAAPVPPAPRPWTERASRWLAPGVPEVARARSARILALALLAAGYFAAVAGASYALALRVVREHFLALGVAAASLALVGVGGLLLSPVERTLERVLGALARVRVLARVLDSPRACLGGLLLFGLAAGAAVLVRHWDVFAYVPWPLVLRIAGAFAFAAVAGLAGPRLPRSLRRAGWGLVAVWAVVATVTAVRLPTHARTAQRIAFEELLTGQAGLALFRAVADFDRDGILSVLGGGDCAPFDAAIHPGALDVPDNGVDENCDGRDLSIQSLPLEGRYDFPVPASVPERPSIVLVTVDAVSPRHMKALGYRREVLPHLDALAARSAFFTAAFAGGPSTRLSFPSMFTSRWDSELERARSPRAPHPITCRDCQLAELLSGAGYHTRAVVPDPYFAPSRWESLPRGFAVYDVEASRHGGNNAEHVTRRAERALDERDPDAPFFLWVHYYDPHSPHERPPSVPPYGDAIEDLYDAELTFVDAEVEALRARVRRELPDALFVVTSDHATVFHPSRGPSRPRYGFDLQTATLHVPLIFDAPWLRRGRHEHLVTSLDLVPTIANLLRLPPGRTFRGQSLVPELLEGRAVRPPLVFHQFYLEELIFLGREPFTKVSLRTDRYDLVLDRLTGREQLFDWRADYYEEHDLLDRESPPAELDALRATLQSYLHWTDTHRGNPAPPPRR